MSNDDQVEGVVDGEADYEGYPPDPDDAAGDQPIVSTAKSVRQRALQKRPNAPAKPYKAKPKKRINQSKILAKERQRKALELRKGGATYEAIAGALQYADASGARKAIERAMKQVIQEPALEVKTLQIERLNHMLLTLWPQVQAGDTAAINTALRVMMQLDGYMGTNEVQKVDVSVHHDGGILVIDGDKNDFITAMKRMAGVDANGHNIPPAIAPTPYVHEDSDVVQGDGGIVDAVIVDDGLDEVTVDIEDPRNTPDAPAESEGKKKFDFGMDPSRYSKG